ncbi:hypothetical protein CH063_04994, partial [Colletotrichum higginsianum]
KRPPFDGCEGNGEEKTMIGRGTWPAETLCWWLVFRPSGLGIVVRSSNLAVCTEECVSKW